MPMLAKCPSFIVVLSEHSTISLRSASSAWMNSGPFDGGNDGNLKIQQCKGLFGLVGVEDVVAVLVSEFTPKAIAIPASVIERSRKLSRYR